MHWRDEASVSVCWLCVLKVCKWCVSPFDCWPDWIVCFVSFNQLSDGCCLWIYIEEFTFFFKRDWFCVIELDAVLHKMV